MLALYADDVIRQNFGRGLKRLRELHGLSQRPLGLAAGYADHTNIAKIESGENSPSLGKALTLASLLGVSVEIIVYLGSEEGMPLGQPCSEAQALSMAAGLRQLANDVQARGPLTNLSLPLPGHQALRGGRVPAGRHGGISPAKSGRL
jgi:transcriptional regulator with XRE-family HTH domain